MPRYPQTVLVSCEIPWDERQNLIEDVFRIGDYIEGDSTVLEKKPLERLTQERQLKAYCHDGFWQCMDTFREQEMLNKMWHSGNAPWKVW